jgi:large subunit ribosomal protein L6
MFEIALPAGVKATVSADSSEVTVSGKLGSATKKVNLTLLSVKADGSKITIDETSNDALKRKASLAAKALESELKQTVIGVEKGFETHLRTLYAHFPISIEVKGETVNVKNIFGEHFPRKARIMGSTKIEVKGQDIFVKGVDPYDVGQTVSNLTKLSFERRKDQRVFQDGIYIVTEE